MNEPNPFEGQASPQLANVGIPPTLGEPPIRNVVPGSSTVVPMPPPLPPRPDLSVPNYGISQGYGYGMGSYGMGGYGGFGYNNMAGGYGMGGMGMGAMPPYGTYNRYGGNMYMGDLESRFVQMAEESSRPAFDSIQGVVSAVGSVAMMLENTFFALTSSFRAILGVAENFGRLRSLFGQFWSTFAVFRTINWIVRKLFVMLGIRTECEFKAWADAVAASQGGTKSTHQQARGGNTWPILLFFGVISAAPYIVHKMLAGLNKSINEKLHDPSSWQEPLRAVVEHDFQATNAQEMSIKAKQILFLAPQHLQNNLWNSGWLMASADMKTSGLVPVNYIKIIKPAVAKETTARKEVIAPDMRHCYAQGL